MRYHVFCFANTASEVRSVSLLRVWKCFRRTSHWYVHSLAKDRRILRSETIRRCRRALHVNRVSFMQSWLHRCMPKLSHSIFFGVWMGLRRGGDVALCAAATRDGFTRRPARWSLSAKLGHSKQRDDPKSRISSLVSLI